MITDLEQASLAGGCFWCLDAVFKQIKGVNKVVSGYSGGFVDNPRYEQLHKENTGHAETVQITFDPEVISFAKLLEVFYSIHDPTTLNRQGNDIGEEYRSIIFYHDKQQKKIAEETTKDFVSKIWSEPIVTEIIPFDRFWPAEDYHQNYYQNNTSAGYCQIIINPKLEKFRKQFRDLLR